MKKNVKSIAVLIILTIMVAFIPNIVRAAETGLSIKPTDNLMSGLITTISSEPGYITVNVDGAKLYDLMSSSKESNIVDGYICERVQIAVADNVDKVEVTDNDSNIVKTYEVKTGSQGKYIEYDLKLYKSGTLADKIKSFFGMVKGTRYNRIYKISMKEYSNGSVVEEYKDIRIDTYEEGISSFLGIADKNNKDLFPGSGEGAYNQIAVETSSTQKAVYYTISTSVNAGKTIKIEGLGTFEYVGKNEYNNNLYRCKIADFSLINKPTTGDTNKFAYTVTDVNTGKTYIAAAEIEVFGAERRTYKVEDRKVGIEVNVASNNALVLKVDEIPETDSAYAKLLEIKGANDSVFDICNIHLEGGTYEGEITITFNVGEEYNGKTIKISHLKSDGKIESFNETVENGKITITVSELSPFMLTTEGATIEETPNQNTETTDLTTTPSTTPTEKAGEKDETPKTGTTVDMITYIGIVTLMSGIGIVAIKRK